ncbi:ATP-grasp domain-containing protein [Cognataquiflexum nitidum]|uniref:ATP-grasp domain-containing protein n=1 Tax=Cognataquiflexum nitidum TaxID=2922272 RepID=UPI001F13E24F|nr:ATP-grasp domain-containing protein [Cognataquiflexum nitidum]
MRKPSEFYSVLIPDGEKAILLKVIYCMSHRSDIRLYVMSTIKDLPLNYSRYIYRFLHCPKKNNELDWINEINKVVEENQIDVIMPIWEKSIRKLIKNKSQLNSNKLVPLPAFSDFLVAGSKDLLAEHLHEIGILGPKTVPLSMELVLDKEKLKLDFPVLAKPLKSGNGQGIIKFENKEALVSHFLECGVNESFVLQEFLNGEDFCCNVLCFDGNILAYTIQKGNLWDSKPFTAQMGMEFVDNEKVIEMIGKLMKSLHWSGVANIDLLYDPKKEVFYVLEINPRFWNSLTGSLMAGVNFPHLLVLLALNKKIENQKYKLISYVNLQGLKLYIKKDKSLLFNFDYIWNSTPLKYKIKDPIPIVYNIIKRFKLKIFGET